MTITSANKYRDKVIALLKAENLPVADLPASLETFAVALQGDELAGVAGLEIYGSYGLLRSLAVDKRFRNKGIALQLLNAVEAMAAENKLQALYLLTETAPGYFTRNGFEQVARTAIPTEVQGSTEFSHVCPQSAIAMKKKLIRNNY
jgi:amino-acid N-acetyltransferase